MHAKKAKKRNDGELINNIQKCNEIYIAALLSVASTIIYLQNKTQIDGNSCKMIMASITEVWGLPVDVG